MYDVYLDGVRLPVTPDKLKLKIGNQNETMNLIDGSEINVLKVPGLTGIEFTAMLPAAPYPFAVYENGFQGPAFYLEKIKALKTEGRPFVFFVSRVHPGGQLLFDTSMRVSVEEYTITEDADKALDVYADVKLKEYRDYGTKKVIITAPAGAGKKEVMQTVKERPADKAPPKTYKIKPGDTLWAIAKREFGDGKRYGELAKLNGIATPNKIAAGQVIKLG